MLLLQTVVIVVVVAARLAWHYNSGEILLRHKSPGSSRARNPHKRQWPAKYTKIQLETIFRIHIAGRGTKNKNKIKKLRESKRLYGKSSERAELTKRTSGKVFPFDLKRKAKKKKWIKRIKNITTQCDCIVSANRADMARARGIVGHLRGRQEEGVSDYNEENWAPTNNNNAEIVENNFSSTSGSDWIRLGGKDLRCVLLPMGVFPGVAKRMEG